MGIDWTKNMRAPSNIELPNALAELLVYDGVTYEAPCICPTRKPGCVFIHGECHPVCAACGGLWQQRYIRK
jgi:hypothetical protein